MCFSPPQAADGGGARGGAAAHPPADGAAPARSLPKQPGPTAAAAGPALPPQLLALRPAEPAALGRGAQGHVGFRGGGGPRVKCELSAGSGDGWLWPATAAAAPAAATRALQVRKPQDSPPESARATTAQRPSLEDGARCSPNRVSTSPAKCAPASSFSPPPPASRRPPRPNLPGKGGVPADQSQRKTPDLSMVLKQRRRAGRAARPGCPWPAMRRRFNLPLRVGPEAPLSHGPGL